MHSHGISFRLSPEVPRHAAETVEHIGQDVESVAPSLPTPRRTVRTLGTAVERGTRSQTCTKVLVPAAAEGYAVCTGLPHALTCSRRSHKLIK